MTGSKLDHSDKSPFIVSENATVSTNMKLRVKPDHSPATLDPVTAEIIHHALASITDQIDKNITRTAFTPLIYEYKDYAVGILDSEARVVAQGRGSLPIFVANALGIAVRDGLNIYGPQRIKPGDVIINNHAGTMGQHLNNVVMYTPIFYGSSPGELVGFMAVLMHWMDVGGAVIGSCFSTDTTDVFQEGIQFRSVKLYSAGEPVEEIYRMIEYNTRFPKMVLGDVAAQLAACFLGRDLVVQLIDKYDLATVRAAIETSWRQTESVAREAIRKIPDGEYVGRSFLDDDGVHPGRTIPIEIKVRIAGDELTVDYSGIADQLGGPLNAGYNGGAVAGARIACKYLFTPGETGNEGAFRPLKVVIPDGKFLSAGPTAPIAGSGYTLPTVVDTIFRALADAAPELVTAAHHGTYGIHVFHGVHPRTGELFQHLESGLGGWGASMHEDGTGPWRSLVHGDMFDTPAEMLEACYPLRLVSSQLRTDSGGAGKFRGGLGAIKRFNVLAPCSVTVYFERTKCLPWGLKGGMEAKAGYVEIHHEGQAPRRILKGEAFLELGDQVHIVCGGGGGFGPPYERDVKRVQVDLANGYISRESGLADYGVVINDRFEVLEAETAAKRANIRRTVLLAGQAESDTQDHQSNGRR